MARPRSPEKRAAILEAAAEEIAASGIGATTAQIARRAGVAEGTLFTYFANKSVLFNELYLELKTEVYTRFEAGAPPEASIKERAWHLWSTHLAWAIEFPARRRSSMLLHLSDILTEETRKAASALGTFARQTVAAIESREALDDMPPGFASRLMASMQEPVLEFAVGSKPAQRRRLIEDGFRLFWRAVR